MSKEAMKLALEALEHLHPTALTSFYTIGDRDRAIEALQEALAKQEQGEPTRHELQAKGDHPAPCARFCEANAFRIAERGYQRQICELSKKLEQLKQEPVTESHKGEPVAWIEPQTKSFMTNEDFENNPFASEQQGNWKPLYTTPQQRKPPTDEQKIILGFLDGSNPLQGIWYGEDHPAFGRAKHWWRRFLRQAFADDFAAHGIKE